MSDLAATHCGDRFDHGINSSFLIIILLLCCCNGNNGLLGNGFTTGCDNNGCGSIIWIILILCLCGNGFSF